METGLQSSTISAEPLESTATHEPAAVAATDENLVPRRTVLCVYCGASDGNKLVHMEAARELARLMAANDMHLGWHPKTYLTQNLGLSDSCL